MCSVCGRVQYYHTVLVKQPQLNHIVVRMVCVVPCNTRFLVIRLFRTHKFSFSSAAAVWRRHSRTNISYWTHTTQHTHTHTNTQFLLVTLTSWFNVQLLVFGWSTIAAAHIVSCACGCVGCLLACLFEMPQRFCMAVYTICDSVCWTLARYIQLETIIKWMPADRVCWLPDLIHIVLRAVLCVMCVCRVECAMRVPESHNTKAPRGRVYISRNRTPAARTASLHSHVSQSIRRMLCNLQLRRDVLNRVLMIGTHTCSNSSNSTAQRVQRAPWDPFCYICPDT